MRRSKELLALEKKWRSDKLYRAIERAYRISMEVSASKVTEALSDALIRARIRLLR